MLKGILASAGTWLLEGILAQVRFGKAVWIIALGFLVPGSLLAEPGPLVHPDDADLQARVARLRDRVEELAGTDDLLDTWHFGWFDRPYSRATLVIALKTTSAIQRELHLRTRGNGAIPEPSQRRGLAGDPVIQNVE